MRDDYAVALRAALVDHVQGGAPARGRFARRSAVLAASLATLLTGAGLAAAAGVFDPPGSPAVRPLSVSVTAEGVGNGTVELGVAPPGTNAVEISLTCLSAGSFTGPDGSVVNCEQSDAGMSTASWRAPATPGQTGIAIRAEATARWRVTAAYSSVSTTDWGVNADGLTYGVANDRGTPDLVAAIATNGAVGYIYSRELQNQTPTTLQTGPPAPEPKTLTVYEADGKTQIGLFQFG